jgi:hypothetical protein
MKDKYNPGCLLFNLALHYEFKGKRAVSIDLANLNSYYSLI